MAPRLRDRSGGFTLVEALVAMTVAALCLVTLAQLWSGAYRGSAAANRASEAAALAADLLAEAQAPSNLVIGRRDGARGAWLSWSVAVEHATIDRVLVEQAAAQGIVPVSVTVDVRWSSGWSNEQRHVRARTLALQTRR